MASLKGEIDRFSSVFSLYGPGTVGSWLCIVASVFVSWTLNAESRRRDTISNDFIAMLSMALVAAGHVFYLLLHSQQSDLFTNTSPEATLYASSVEAPLNVCETFVVALALFPIAGLRDHRWRAGAILGIAFLHSRQRQSFSRRIRGLSWRRRAIWPARFCSTFSRPWC